MSEQHVSLTHHAWQRMCARGFSPQTLDTVLAYGRVARVRGADIYAIGRSEVSQYRNRGVDLEQYEGVQVVCTPQGKILTVYRNRDFRGLRPRRKRRPSNARRRWRMRCR